MARFTVFLALLAAAVQSSPTPDVLQRDFAKGKLPEVLCKKVNVIVTVLKLYKATPFCSSYLGISAVTSTSSAVATTTFITTDRTLTVTAPYITTTTTSIVTVASGTSYVFRPGSTPNSGNPRRAQAIEERNNEPQKPAYLSPFGKDVISSGCKCLDIPVKTVVVSTTSTSTSTLTTTAIETTTLVYTETETSTQTVPISTTTLYPCAEPVPTLIKTLPYGDAVFSSESPTANTRFGLDTPEGASVESCCNACYFGVTNCIQAYWYSYQGCVVRQASSSGSGDGVSSSCPSGLFSGLTYRPNEVAAFRSTGNFAGPCGVQYNNL